MFDNYVTYFSIKFRIIRQTLILCGIVLVYNSHYCVKICVAGIVSIYVLLVMLGFLHC